MKEKLLFLFSLLIICNKTSVSLEENSGLIFFTNFNYFKSNEKNFKDVGVQDEALSATLTSEDNPVTPPFEKPDTDKPISPEIKPELPIPPDENTPSIKPPAPEQPEVPEEKYTEIFFENTWIWNTHSYVDSEDVIVSAESGVLTGMGAVQSGFSVENIKNILVNGVEGEASYLGMLSLNGGEITNGESGTISLQGTGNNFGMGVIGDGRGTNLGNIYLQTTGVGMYGTGTSTVNNKGTIILSSSSIKSSNTQTGVGIYITEQGVGENTGTITVGNNQVGMLVNQSGSIFNSGVISVNSQGIGMLANNASTNSFLLNEETGVIKGDAQAGIVVSGSSSTQNYGEIDISNGVAGMVIDGQGSGYNFGSINLTNTKYGMLSQNGGLIVNGASGYDSTIITDNTEFAKMAVLGSGTALNYNTLSSEDVKYVMYLSGTGNITNYGTLSLNLADEFEQSVVIYGEDGGSIVNYQGATINIDGGVDNYGIVMNGSGNVSNYGTINVGAYQHGILLSEDATGTNNGDINISVLGSGVVLYNTTTNSLFRNFGTIKDGYQGQGAYYGIVANGAGSVENSGIINLTNGSAGISISGTGTATNMSAGEILIKGTRYGMYATKGATIKNEGIISREPVFGTYLGSVGSMYVSGSGSALNDGTITVGGSHINAMASTGSASTLVNGTSGTINILDGAVDNFAFNVSGGTATNKGVINLGDSGGLITGGTLFNYGNIEAPNGIINGPNGKLVMEQGGTTNAKLQMATLGLSYALDLYTIGDSSYSPVSISFDTENVQAYSYLYDVNLAGDSIYMRRKDFREITESEIGEFLESIYYDSNNLSKDKFFNILKSSETQQQYQNYLDKFFGRYIYPAVIFQTRDSIIYTTEDILENLNQKLTNNRKESYIVGYTFEKFRQKGFDRVKGHDDNLNGFYLGKQYYLDEKSDYGMVLSYTRLDSDYKSNVGEREDNFLQGTAFLNYDFENVKCIGTMYLGFSKGDIKRNLNLEYLDYQDLSPMYENINERYKGNTKNFYIGTSGKISKRYNMSKFFLEPELGAYAMGIFQNKINESGGEYELKVDDLNRFFGKVNAQVGVGKVFNPKNYMLTFKIIGGLGQEINSPNDDLKVSLKNVENEKVKVKVDRENQFSKELGVKVNVEKVGINNLNLYMNYRYIFEDENSWKIGAGLAYRF